MLLVVGYHSHGPLLTGGLIGVDIFFVLSGFLITRILLREVRETGRVSLFNFYVRRALRLVPALAVMLIGYVTISWALFGTPALKSHFVDALTAFLYVSNWTRAFGSGRPDILGHTWSLGIEEQFYLLWGAGIFYAFRSGLSLRTLLRLTVIVIVAISFYRVALVLGGASVSRVYYGLDTRLDALLVGCASAMYSALHEDRANRLFRKLRWSGATALVLLAFAAGALFYGPPLIPVLNAVGFSGVAIVSAFLILDITHNENSAVRRWLSGPQIVRVGVISYGLYLWHYPIMRWIARDDWPHAWRWPAVLIAGTMLAFAAATLSYRLVERPFLELKKRFAARPVRAPAL